MSDLEPHRWPRAGAGRRRRDAEPRPAARTGPGEDPAGGPRTPAADCPDARAAWQALLRDVLAAGSLWERLSRGVDPERWRRFERCWEEAERLEAAGSSAAPGAATRSQ